MAVPTGYEVLSSKSRLTVAWMIDGTDDDHLAVLVISKKLLSARNGIRLVDLDDAFHGSR